jgi:hypothetical protein
MSVAKSVANIKKVFITMSTMSEKLVVTAPNGLTGIIADPCSKTHSH